ncbi:carboxylesterase [Paenibacillus baekrokdamisoli]|uniref:Carboxylesterase n=1 Tax=Paenibacillus baekrokdamisoli TaxID=1712516 RepID=A0A3G9IXT8_9BACL|nr:alpha/beta hydrolase [Paenibacillus baekrokdamisoli]MBB3068853.1 phospholipase/carboxylesterase [Paenibacillus baekrokdamisoli]BBH23680.1 carboxylesterase [Paenibacillus baekrokdamisoli]
MKHIFQEGLDKDAKVLVLLHGTGGTERDLLPLAERIAPRSSVLSIRGNVLENGMPRFFRRLAEGIFDEEDLLFRTKELNDFLDKAAVDYGFDRQNLVAIGYSNGANIAGSLLFHHPHALKGAILHHPMVPRRGVALPDMTGLPCFIGAGKNDPICSPEETEELSTLLKQAGASVTVHWESYGHQLTQPEVEAAAQWYQQAF